MPAKTCVDASSLHVCVVVFMVSVHGPAAYFLKFGSLLS